MTDKCISNSLKISDMRMGGGKIRLSILRTLTVLFIVVLFAFTFIKGYRAGVLSGRTPVVLVYYHPRYFSNDSLHLYAQRAYENDDPEAQFITAAAAWLKEEGRIPDTMFTVPLSETPMLLYRAALHGHSQATQAVHFMIENDDWHLPLPEDK